MAEPVLSIDSGRVVYVLLGDDRLARADKCLMLNSYRIDR